ncbi:MAG: hypothetical protein AAF583_00585 [Pseudomonadota bacterium]
MTTIIDQTEYQPMEEQLTSGPSESTGAQSGQYTIEPRRLAAAMRRAESRRQRLVAS